ncbi:hypothetical protein M8C21_004299 [Ambrosia artemisiifolia]|uniref:ATP-dependent RNA helicase n=1 Tax=Ambrosia artemisiifolia TaxID=4212 RepID=A0AAD5D9G6_AMBAR|nr:hypothetical protein M8C21_004299 [Ambrosia artemisiifolia]
MKEGAEDLWNEADGPIKSPSLQQLVWRVSQLVLQREHAHINTVGLGPETHVKVPNYKVIVFCTTAMMTSLMFSLLREMKMNVREIHSRKPQLYRTRVSEEFKQEKQLILITSDVSSRGMNYPDVSLVIQGVKAKVEKEYCCLRHGKNIFLKKLKISLTTFRPRYENEGFNLAGLPILPALIIIIPSRDASLIGNFDLLAKVDPSVKEAAYHAWLGYYNSIREIGRDKTTLVELADESWFAAKIS